MKKIIFILNPLFQGINLFKKMSFDKDFLEEDLNTITRINELVRNIVYPHQVKLLMKLEIFSGKVKVV